MKETVFTGWKREAASALQSYRRMKSLIAAHDAGVRAANDPEMAALRDAIALTDGGIRPARRAACALAAANGKRGTGAGTISGAALQRDGAGEAGSAAQADRVDAMMRTLPKTDAEGAAREALSRMDGRAYTMRCAVRRSNGERTGGRLQQRLPTAHEIALMRGWVMAIDSARAMLEREYPLKARFMARCFGLDTPIPRGQGAYERVIKLSMDLNTSESTLYRWREEILALVLFGAIESGAIRPFGIRAEHKSAP